MQQTVKGNEFMNSQRWIREKQLTKWSFQQTLNNRIELRHTLSQIKGSCIDIFLYMESMLYICICLYLYLSIYLPAYLFQITSNLCLNFSLRNSRST